MSATERLRELLYERGIEYDAVNEYVTVVYMDDRYITYLAQGNDMRAEVVYPRPVFNGTEWLTPEQAIAATLGNGTLTAEQVRETVNGHGNIMDNRLYCDWQAIADELNAMLGGGECENVAGESVNAFKCSECGRLEWRDEPTHEPIRFCPNCGAMVRKAVER